MLDDPRLAKLPEGVVFSEDQQMYYGTGWCGQTALYQIVYHTGPKPSHEEKAPETWDKVDKLCEGYRITVSGGLPGTALAAQLMGAKALWNHDAFFDYYDRWMSADDPYAAKRNGNPRQRRRGARWTLLSMRCGRLTGIKCRRRRVERITCAGSGRMTAGRADSFRIRKTRVSPPSASWWPESPEPIAAWDR